MNEVRNSDEVAAAHPTGWRRYVSIDYLLLRWMPNLTVIRRFVMGSWILKIVVVGGLLLLIDRVDENGNRSEQAICAVVIYAEETAPLIQSGAGRARLEKLASDMRKTRVECPPRERQKILSPPAPTRTP